LRGDDATENKLDKFNLRLNIGLEGNPVINNFTINLLKKSYLWGKIIMKIAVDLYAS